MPMKVPSVNVGLPKKVFFNRQTGTTAIFKDPVKGPIMLRKLNLDDEKQAALAVNGEVDKEAYSYPAEHYNCWCKQFPNIDFIWEILGENFITDGLMEDAANICDLFQIGSSKLVATQPRMPYYKLGVRFARIGVIRRFMTHGCSGIYFKVLREARVRAGDKIELIKHKKNKVRVKDTVRLYIDRKEDIQTVQKAVNIKALPEG
jgi:MOSC domain-containing protein YiiM